MNWKAIIALAVLLAAGLGTWAWLQGRGNGSDLPPESAERVFPGVSSGDVQQCNLLWRDADGTETAVVFARAKNGGWDLSAGNLSDVGDPSHIRKVVEALVKLRQRRAVALDAGTDYGLQPAEVELRATLTDGRAIGVLIGKVAWTENLRYLQVAGEEQVRIVADELYGHCRHPVAWFRDHHVLTIPNFEIGKFSVTTPAGTMALEKQAPSAGAAATQQGATWTQTAPVADDADTTVVQDFLGRLYRDAQARRFIDQVVPADRAGYGLDEPFLSVTVTGDQGRTCTVQYSEGTGEHLGKTVPTLYALRDGRLFDCGPDHLEQLRVRDLQFFRSTKISRVSDQQLNLLQVSAPGRPRWSVVREGHKWSIAEPRRLTVDAIRVGALSDAVDGLKAERFYDQAGPGDWATFGVDDANGTRVKLADTTGRHDTFVVGELVPETQGTLRYVRITEGDRLRAVSSRFADLLTGGNRGWLFFLNKQLWDVTSPEVTRLRIEVRDGDAVHTAGWDVKLEAGAPRLTLREGSTDHAAGLDPELLSDTLSSLATLRARHWVQDGHAGLERFGLTEDAWRLRLTLTLQRGDAAQTRTLVIGAETLWPAFRGQPTPEDYARTGEGETLAGSMIFTLQPPVLEGLRKLVVPE